MNIKKIEKQLKKINQLFETIKEDGTMSAIERDLMLSYIRGLYEKLVSPQNHSSDDYSRPSTSTKVVKKVEALPTVETFQKANTHIADVVMKEVVEADRFISQPTTPTNISNAVSATIPQTATIPEVIEESKPEVPQDILDLFKFETINELSDKLSRAPISDLTKCMGINEKIFTVQELFGGDMTMFTEALSKLDKFTSLEQARDYLVEHVAVDQEWSESSRMKKAANFIKLISRRY